MQLLTAVQFNQSVCSVRTVMTLPHSDDCQSVAHNVNGIKEKNALIAGDSFGVNYSMNGEHIDEKNDKRVNLFSGILTFHLQAIMNLPAMLNQCYWSLWLALY